MKRIFVLLIGLIPFLITDALAGMWFWDTNGTAPGCGSATPDGTWGVDAYWNTNFTGGASNEAGKPWTDGATAVFAAGNDATGSYTIYVSNLVKVADIHVDRGTVTFAPHPVAGGALDLVAWVKVNPDDVFPSLVDTTNRLLSVGHYDPDCVARYNVPLTAATNLFRYKRGTLIFGATNTFAGTLTIEGGVVQCAVPHALSAANPLVLANNDPGRVDFDTAWRYTPAVFHTGGLNQQLGTLKLGGTDASVVRAIDFGNGAGTLSFADSSAEDWGGFMLIIQNYAPGSSKLRFGTNSSGLTAAQLGQTQFAGFVNLPGVIDSSGYVTPALPKITVITHSSGSVEIVWTAVNGRTYYVWTKNTLSASSWDGPTGVYATGDTASYTDSTPSPTGRFYRVEVAPQ